MDPKELAAAVAGRVHWRREGRAAVYAPPDTTATVRVLPVPGATRRARFIAVINRGGQAEHSRPCGTALEAVAWAERVRLS
jgi:hypothetical protein